MSELRRRDFRLIPGANQDNSLLLDDREPAKERRQTHTKTLDYSSGTSVVEQRQDLEPKLAKKRFRTFRILVTFFGTSHTRSELGYVELDEELKAQELERASTQLGFALKLLVVLLVLVGAAMVLSTSFVPSLGAKGTGSPFAIFERQLLWIMAGLAAFFIVSRLNPKRLAPYARLMIIPVILLLLLVLVPGVGVAVSGSSRWVGFSFLRIQPSEAAKLAVVLYLAGFLTPAVPERLRSLRAVFPAIWLVGLAAFLVLAEPDMGTSLVLGTILLGVFFLAGMRMRIYIPFVLTTVTLAIVAAFYEPYRRQRLLSFLHPWQNRLADSYQEVQGLVAFATGGTTGVGLGAGSAKWGYLPNSQTDFIFAILGQEAGFIGCMVVLAALVALCVVVMRIGLRAGSRFEYLLCAGVAIWIGSQTAFNVGAVLGVFPVTGVPLPLISAGGSSLTILLVSLGLVYGVARRPGQVFAVGNSKKHNRAKHSVS